MKSLRLIALLALIAVLVPVHAFAVINCGFGIAPCGSTPTQGIQLFNTETTGAATTAVTVTLTAVTGERVVVHSIEARCNTAAATANLLVSDGGVTIWSSGPLAVIAAQPQYRHEWGTGLTGATNSQVLVTLSACTAGTGTLIVQASKH